MCGIVGLWRREGTRPASRRDVEAMRDVMVHRGPDDQGLESFCGGRVWLAHRRLSIQDVSAAGHQPMASADGRLSIVFNGEIYNFQSLRRTLEGRGHRFRSGTDTEVILAAYEDWGPDCLARFNGMFALGIWDDRRRRLFCARDRLGIKPFYFHRSDDTFAFASEIRALLASPWLSAEVEPGAAAAYLKDGQVDGLQQTLLRGVERLAPGESITLDENGLSVEAYWSLPTKKTRPGAVDDAHVERFRALFDEAVGLRLISDVPVGTCLSGGLDSSSIVAAATLWGRRPMKAFSAFFSEAQEFDERPFAAQMVERYAADWYQTEPPGDALLERLPTILWHLEEPSMAMGVYPQWHVMELASRHVTVLLDGQGGDEVLAGYDRYGRERLGELRRRRAWRDLAIETAIFGRRNGLLSLARAALPAAVGRVAGDRSRAGREHFLRALSVEVRGARGRAPRVAPTHDCDRLNRVLRRDVQFARLPALLKYEDKLGMAFSIEARVPFLDHRLVELLFSLPSDAKYYRGWSKYILRRAMDGRLPGPIQWSRDKRGFPTPVRLWFRGDTLRGALDQLAAGRAVEGGWLDRRGTRSLIDQHRSGAFDFSWELWRLVSFELWLGLVDRLADRSLAQPFVSR